MKLLRRNPTTGNFQEVEVNVSGNPSANNGMMFDTTNLVLGQAVNAANDPAKLLSAREIPTDGNEFSFVERKANAILLVRLTGRTGDTLTKSILEFTNGETYATAPNGIMQLAYMADKTLRFWGKDGTNGWKNSLTVEPDGDIAVQKSIFVRQDGQVGTSLYEIRQDPGTGQTDVLNLKRSGTSTTGGADPSYTLLEIEAPTRTLAADPQEATISLSRKFDTRNEFLDVFNNGYPSGTFPSMDMGLRVQKRGAGILRPLVFQFASGLSSVVDALRFTPLVVNGSGVVTDGEVTFKAPFRPVLANSLGLEFGDGDSSHRIILKAPNTVPNSYSLNLPSAPPSPGQVLQATNATDLTWAAASGGGTTTYITAAYTVQTNDDVILFNFSTNQNINLISAVGRRGKRLTFKKIFGAGNGNIIPFGAETIDGGGTQVIATTNEAFTLVSDDANWFIESRVQNASGALYTASNVGTTLTNVVWSGVAPTGISYRYRWSRAGNVTTVEVHGFGTAVGTSTGIDFSLPTNCPTPEEFNANNNGQFAVSTAAFGNTSAIIGQSRGGMIRTASGWTISLSWASGSVRFFSCFITYRSTPGTGSLDP